MQRVSRPEPIQIPIDHEHILRVYEESTADSYMKYLEDLVVSLGGDLVLIICAECGKPVDRKTKHARKFCSIQCASRMTSREWRRNKRAQEKANASPA